MNRRLFVFGGLGLIAGCSGVSISSSGAGIGAAPSQGSNPPSWMRWKPISESDHKLVILTRRPVRSITVCGEKGRSDKRSATDNGYQDAFRFSKPGSQYDSPCEVVVDGEVYVIANPGGDYN